MENNVILVVDDDPCCRYTLEVLLRSYGFAVLSARNGMEAVEVAFAHTPMMIFMDLTMPGMDGYAATRAIHARRFTADTPVAALSTHSDREHRSKAFEAGMVEFIPKPWTPSDIQRTLNKYACSHQV